ncbi:hypothetical protein [Mycobacterium sp. HUMS_1102779]
MTLKTKGESLDTRLRHKLLLDAKLQRKLTAEEFRAFINLNVWVVSLISDGVFDPTDAEMVANLDSGHIARFLAMGLVECDDAGLYRVNADYWAWQSTRAQLEEQERVREANRARQEAWRANQKREA